MAHLERAAETAQKGQKGMKGMKGQKGMKGMESRRRIRVWDRRLESRGWPKGTAQGDGPMGRKMKGGQ